MLDFDLAGVGEISFLATVVLYENSCTFVLPCNRSRPIDWALISHLVLKNKERRSTDYSPSHR